MSRTAQLYTYVYCDQHEIRSFGAVLLADRRRGAGEGGTRAAENRSRGGLAAWMRHITNSHATCGCLQRAASGPASMASVRCFQRSQLPCMAWAWVRAHAWSALDPTPRWRLSFVAGCGPDRWGRAEGACAVGRGRGHGAPHTRTTPAELTMRIGGAPILSAEVPRITLPAAAGLRRERGMLTGGAGAAAGGAAGGGFVSRAAGPMCARRWPMASVRSGYATSCACACRPSRSRMSSRERM